MTYFHLLSSTNPYNFQFFFPYMNNIHQIIFITKHIAANIISLFNLIEIFFRERKLNAFIIKIINHIFICFYYSFRIYFNGFKCLIWHQSKHLFSLFLILIKPFVEFLNLQGNSVYTIFDNGLKTEILTYSASFDNSITKPDPSLMQLSIQYKIYWKDLSSMYLELVTVLVVELA